jgi:hypothetical protein
MEEMACMHTHPKTGQKIHGHLLEVDDVIAASDLYDSEDGWRSCTLLAGTPLQYDFHGIVVRPVSHPHSSS